MDSAKQRPDWRTVTGSIAIVAASMWTDYATYYYSALLFFAVGLPGAIFLKAPRARWFALSLLYGGAVLPILLIALWYGIESLWRGIEGARLMR